MKQLTLIAAIALASTSVFAQAPASVTPRPPAEANPARSGGTPAAKAEANKDAKVANSAPSGMDYKSMDANGDGMISQQEYTAYHTGRWGKMKMTRDGMISLQDMQAQMRSSGGPN